ncbi:MAG: type II secretion system F family protein [Halobacteriales archaeon]
MSLAEKLPFGGGGAEPVDDVESPEGEIEPEPRDSVVAKLDRFAYGLFGSYFESKKDSYAGYRKKINQARMEVGYDMYLSRITLYSIITGVIGAVIGVAVAALLASMGFFQDVSIAVTLPSGAAEAVSAYADYIAGFFIMLVMTAVLGGITGGILYYIPSFKAGERKREIDNTLPFAVTFMYALSRGGMNIIEVMRKLANAEDVYGEVANEFDMMLRDMDYFGNDLRIALRNTSDMTPSENLSDFLDDLLSVIDSGGEMTPFLLNKSQQYHEIKKQDQKGFLDTLALMSESYVTAFVAAPLFIIIIMTIMSVMGGAEMMQLYAIIYLVLPIASLGFAFVIDIIATGDASATKQLEMEREVFTLEDVEEIASRADDDRIDDLVQAKKMQTFKDFARDPLQGIKERPMLSLAFTAPLAVIVFAAMVLSGLATLSMDAMLEDPIWNTIALAILPMMLMVMPLSVFHEIKKRREKKIIRELPETLKKLSSANETGMTLNESLLLVSKTSSGVLSRELKKVHNEIQWGSNLNDALISFANRMRIPRLSRTIKLLTKANESSGDVQGVLEVAARDVDSAYKLDRERFQNMIIYTVIIIISFLVFLFVIVILDNQFLGEMTDVGGGGDAASAAEDAGGGGGGAAGGAFNVADIPIEQYRMVFFHAGVIQAFCSGLVAGQMGENDIMSGLKYGIVMTLVAVVVFLFI